MITKARRGCRKNHDRVCLQNIEILAVLNSWNLDRRSEVVDSSIARSETFLKLRMRSCLIAKKEPEPLTKSLLLPKLRCTVSDKVTDSARALFRVVLSDPILQDEDHPRGPNENGWQLCRRHITLNWSFYEIFSLTRDSLRPDSRDFRERLRPRHVDRSCDRFSHS